MNKYQNFLSIVLIFAVVTLIILFSGGINLFWPLYYVPVFLAALFFNEIGGAGVGVVASLCLFGFMYLFIPVEEFGVTNLPVEFSVASGVMISAGYVFGWFVRVQKKRLAEMSEGSMIDRLTMLHNYGYFAERLEEERKRADRFGSRLALMIIDVDNFKSFNDRFGHAGGNLLLKKLAGIIEEHVRDVDIVARYGGEEFVVILPNTEEEALSVAKRIRAAVEAAGFEGDQNEPVVGRTVSIGVAIYPNDCENDLELIDCADKALNRAKISGRNRVIQYDSKKDAASFK
jgi:diguanylate cyclase (GGDEF)-like protein